ncbi:MAG: sigma-70 family RNA polymerase sigma factor [Lentisphaeraceae bacterium]|nr:sigma-70 family RNA polymerase sigma factor [Lentisphaeraceae bacterium]
MSRQYNTRQTLLIKLRDQYDDSAWKEFLEFYRPYIYRVVQNFKNIQTADREDIIQNVMVIAWKRLPTFEYKKDKGGFRYWLSKVTQNAVYAYWNKNTKNSFFDEAENAAELQNGLDPEIDRISNEEWKKYIVEKAWENVKKQFNEVSLEVFERLSSGEKGEDVAKDLKLSANSIYVYKKRVLAALQKEISYLDE